MKELSLRVAKTQYTRLHATPVPRVILCAQGPVEALRAMTPQTNELTRTAVTSTAL